MNKYKEEIYKRASELSQLRNQLTLTHPLFPLAAKEHYYPQLMEKGKDRGTLGGAAIGGLAGGVAALKALPKKLKVPVLAGSTALGALIGRKGGEIKTKGDFREAGKDYDKIMKRVKGSKAIVERDVNEVMKRVEEVLKNKNK